MTLKNNSVEKKFKKLNEIEHVLARPGRYIGGVKPHSVTDWVLDDEWKQFQKEEVTWSPGLLKIFDEILSNSVDASKDKDLPFPPTTIKVTINEDTGEIEVFDDGGIPVAIHSEYNQYVPEMIFGEMRAGSNFDDSEESDKAGQNGEGASLTNIYSTSFKVETADGKNKFVQTFTKNMHERTQPKITPSDKHYTRITFTPDYARLECDISNNNGNFKKLVKRVIDAAGCNPQLKIYLNGDQIKIKTFEDYVKMYTEDYLYFENKDWQIGICAARDGFEHVSFVNNTQSFVGGTHVQYISNQIENGLRAFFAKKHKTDIKPSQIRDHYMLFINARIINPRYSSQTKENLITEVKEFGTKFEVDDKMIKKITTTEITSSILDWIEAKKNADERKAERDANKDLQSMSLRDIIKYEPATSTNRSKCMLFLAEGDSAAKAIQSAGGKQFIGTMPLKGKPKNIWGLKRSEIAENAEIKYLMRIVGLKLGQPVTSITELRYGKIVFMTDADNDGLHICGLLLNFFGTQWPELIKMGVLCIFRTPLVKVTMGKQILPFYNEDEFKVWKEKNKDKKYTSKYYKGLGTSKTPEFKEYLADLDTHLVQLTHSKDENDADFIDLAFNKKRADDRKVWLDIERKAV